MKSKRSGVYIFYFKGYPSIYTGVSKDLNDRMIKHRRLVIKAVKSDATKREEILNYIENDLIIKPIILCDEVHMHVYETLLIEVYKRCWRGSGQNNGHHRGRLVNGKIKIPNYFFSRIEEYICKQHRDDHDLDLLLEVLRDVESDFSPKLDAKNYTEYFKSWSSFQNYEK